MLVFREGGGEPAKCDELNIQWAQPLEENGIEWNGMKQAWSNNGPKGPKRASQAF